MRQWRQRPELNLCKNRGKLSVESIEFYNNSYYYLIFNVVHTGYRVVFQT